MLYIDEDDLMDSLLETVKKESKDYYESKKAADDWILIPEHVLRPIVNAVLFAKFNALAKKIEKAIKTQKDVIETVIRNNGDFNIEALGVLNGLEASLHYLRGGKIFYYSYDSENKKLVRKKLL